MPRNAGYGKARFLDGGRRIPALQIRSSLYNTDGYVYNSLFGCGNPLGRPGPAKNDEMQGGRILRNEAYNPHATLTKDEAQHSRSRVSTAG